VILVVGLGNPGARYEKTRHNVGFMVVSRLAAQCGAGAWRDRFDGKLTAFEIEGEPALGLLPQTFMNDSGRSVGRVLAFYKLELSDMLVVHDELDLPFGELRLKQGGGDAGHRGLGSVSDVLGSNDYPRLRVGIGRPPPDFPGDVADFVLEGFALSERAALDEVLARAAEAVTLVTTRGLSAAMNVVNQKQKPVAP
jgi:PTH1 family peptidyl-tRNA hydrolase